MKKSNIIISMGKNQFLYFISDILGVGLRGGA